MRKYQQQKILKWLHTIGQIQSKGLYGDCQDAAIAVCDFIENIVGEGTHTEAMLIKYCELLYKANQGEIEESLLRECLIQVENSVQTELKPNRIEMVFLSHKASMSDSIESIYLTAKADPSCDAYWIPIPYIERKPDRSVGKICYEGPKSYSKDIECTDWQQYDIKARRPDVIFTFNPYDSVNFVTSVHPDFYCKRLRDLTDLLCYVPYFVAINDVSEQFCTTPGCMFAHKVIVQSEEIRDIYVDTFKKAYGDEFGKAEDKFIALGSPKYDKVMNTKREDCELPDDWKKLIYSRR